MTTQTESHTRFHGRWLSLARLAWVVGFMALTAMYALGFLAVHDSLSTVCENDLCTLRVQIQQTRSGEEVVNWGGPPFGYVDRLRPDQVKVLGTFGLTLDEYGWLGALQMGIPILIYLLIALGLFWRKSDDWMVMFISVMIATFPLQNTPLPFTLAMRHPGWEWINTIGRMVAVACFFTFPLIFPSGHFVPRWTRWMAWFVVASTIIVTGFGVPERNIVGNVSQIEVWAVALFGTGVYAQLYRYFRVATPVERQQIKWLIVGMAVFLITGEAMLRPWDSLLTPRLASMDFAQALAQSTLIDVIFTIVSLFIPVSIAISVLRYRLWDIEIIINRTLVYGALTAVIAGTYALVVGALGALFQARGSLLVAILATGFAALLFQPLRQRLQRAVNRLMYGPGRDDPYAVLARLGQRLEGSLTPTTVLPTVAVTVREVLRLPYVAVYLQEGPEAFKLVAESVTPNLRSENGSWHVPGMESNGLCMPLVYQGETVGYIVFGPHAPGEAFTPAERKLLGDLARQAGVAAHAVRLTADLQYARERLVAAREEARRRLGSDLHDGVGHQLAGLARNAEMAANLFEREPTAARELLTEVTQQLNAAIVQVRGLAHQLHPPELELLGLAGALRERAQTYTGLTLRIDAPEVLPPLPTAVETAAYYIALEALTNVEKHAGAKSCHIRLALAKDALELDITDDGRGLPPEKANGLGLLSMQARAAEVGGICRIGSTQQSGTRVSVRLPCRAQLE